MVRYAGTNLRIGVFGPSGTGLEPNIAYAALERVMHADQLRVGGDTWYGRPIHRRFGTAGGRSIRAAALRVGWTGVMRRTIPNGLSPDPTV
jgi:hypothetical protein